MKYPRISLCFLFLVLSAIAILNNNNVSMAQLSPSETRILLQVQKLLEYPQVLKSWNNWTNYCYLPSSPSLKIVCTNSHVSELTIVGNKTPPPQKPTSGKFVASQQTLSPGFSIDVFFTVLTKLSSLKVLSLVSLGLWGSFPAKISRFWSLEVLNMSSNFIYGQIPREILALQQLSSLVLANNLLNGSVPDLKRLAQLQVLNLSANFIGPEFVSLGDNIVTVLLSNNSIRSNIPSTIKNLYQLQQLDLSFNNLIGPIPPSLFSLPSIQYLNLAENQLSGAIQSNLSCNKNLKFLDISHNLLIGNLPSSIASNSSNRTVISAWNCLSGNSSRQQQPYSFCQQEALAVNPRPESEQSGSSRGLVLGIIGGAVGLVCVTGLLILVIARRRSDNSIADHEVKFNGSTADKMSVRSCSSIRTIDSRRVPQTMRSAAIGLPPYRAFALDEVEDATDNFDPSNLLGEGPWGQLYKGQLVDGSVVLVRTAKSKLKHLPQNLAQQMEVLSKLRHLHIVSVLGHCIITYQENSSTFCTVFVVLEHVSNRSLRDYLEDEKKKEVLKWPQRMAITMGIARGIQFLHTGVAPGIFGNNVNIENVVLDETLTAKLSNYTIPLPSKESKVNGQDTQNLNSIEHGEKEDVYQFGVILLHMITGKLVASPTEINESKTQLERSLGETSKLREVVDPATRGSFASESLRTTVEITLNCLSGDPRNRPSIEDVLWNMQYSVQVQEGWNLE